MKKANSPSGILAISIIRLQDVVSFRIRRGVAYVAIKEGASFEDIPISKTGTLNFQDAPYSVEVNVPTPDAINTSYLSSLVGVNVIVRLKMISATYYIGSDRFPAKVSFANTNNVEIGNYAGYVLKASSMEVSLHGDCTVVATPTTPTDPTDPTTPTDPVTPPAETVTKIPLVANIDSSAGSLDGVGMSGISGSIMSREFDDRTTDPSFNPFGKFETSNSGDILIFENKAVFPKYFGRPPLVCYPFENLNIECSKVKLKLKFTTSDPNHTFLEKHYYYGGERLSTSDCLILYKDSSGVGHSISTERSKYTDLGNGLYEIHLPVNGIIYYFDFRFELEFLYKIEIQEFGYIQ